MKAKQVSDLILFGEDLFGLKGHLAYQTQPFSLAWCPSLLIRRTPAIDVSGSEQSNRHHEG